MGGREGVGSGKGGSCIVSLRHSLTGRMAPRQLSKTPRRPVRRTDVWVKKLAV